MRHRTWLFLAVGGASLTFASSASAQALGGVVQTVGTVTAPVTQTVQATVASATQTVAPVTQPVTHGVKPVTKPVTQTVSGVANTVGGVAQTAPAAPKPVTDTVSGATGGGGSGARGGTGSAPSAATDSGTSPGQSTVVRGTEKCPPGSKQAGGGGGGGQAGGGGGSSIFLTAAAAERGVSMQREVQRTKQRPAGGDTTGQLARAGGEEGDDDRGRFLVPGFPNSDEYPASVGLALLGVLALGFVGVIAGATSHVLTRVRSS